MKYFLSLVILAMAFNTFANTQEECFKGNKKSCDKYLLGVLQQNRKDFEAAYTKICAEPSLNLKCEKIQSDGTKDQMKKLTTVDANGAFYRPEKMGSIYHVTPLN